MAIISANNRRLLGSYLKLAQSLEGGSRGRYVRVTCKSNEAGKKARDIMKQYWPEIGDNSGSSPLHYEYLRSNEGKPGAWNDWSTFSVVPSGPTGMIATACQEIADELRAIIEGVSDGTIPPPTGPGTPGTGDNDTPGTGDNDTTKKATDWITYLVIGGAAIAIILLLWDKNRK